MEQEVEIKKTKTKGKRKTKITDDNFEIKKEEVKQINPFRDILRYVFEIARLKYKTVVANIPKSLPVCKEDEDCKDNTIGENDISRWITKGCKPWYKKTVRRLAIGVSKSININDKGHIGRKSKEAFIIDCGTIFGWYNQSFDWYASLNTETTYAEAVEKAILLAYDKIESPKNEATPSQSMQKGAPVDEETRKRIQQNRERPKKVAAFDFDGTLLRGVGSSWEVLYNAAGITNNNAMANYELFRTGKISYPEWVERDVEELKAAGLKRHLVYHKVKECCKIMDHLKEGLQKLKANGYAVAIISGGVDTVMSATLQECEALFDVKFINKAIYDPQSNALTDIIATPYDWSDDGELRGVAGKNMGLKKVCAHYGLTLKDAVFVGDAENDLKAMRVAGRRIFVVGKGRNRLKLPEETEIFVGDDFMELADSILEEPTM